MYLEQVHQYLLARSSPSQRCTRPWLHSSSSVIEREPSQLRFFGMVWHAHDGVKALLMPAVLQSGLGKNMRDGTGVRAGSVLVGPVRFSLAACVGLSCGNSWNGFYGSFVVSVPLLQMYDAGSLPATMSVSVFTCLQGFNSCVRFVIVSSTDGEDRRFPELFTSSYLSASKYSSDQLFHGVLSSFHGACISPLHFCGICLHVLHIVCISLVLL